MGRIFVFCAGVVTGIYLEQTFDSIPNVRRTFDLIKARLDVWIEENSKPDADRKK
ncbi:protein of unknown function (DUF4535) [Plasmodiophora brassicae]|uniref:Uncharacterized protein n=1 Tax=Plasmodiophora brassicae TaxID=37360 RepID=A0A0G4J480_PLABS|nr:hypothetical protein PBRA_008964 [Plasmodiophora brassicae]